MTLFDKPAFMPYVCCGDPDADATIKLVKKLVASGADAIELGIPFSDPIADGKTIQAASERALANGMTPDKALGVIKKLRTDGVAVPIYIMTYYNIVFTNGLDGFVHKARDAGANGLIIPDLPLEESEELRLLCEDAGLGLVGFVTPNTSDERLKKIAEHAGGFLYAVAVYGTTGTRKDVSADAIALIKRAKALTKMPVAVGFGISEPAQAKEYADAGADGVIVGSRIVDIYRKDGLDGVAKFASAIKKAISGADT